jgi:uncharacterized protein
MARPQKSRTIDTPPQMRGFKPYGIPCNKPRTIKMSFEEYECIKLVGYDKLSQEQAAERMKISRPTLTRIYNKAINTIATGFIEGRTIEISGGNYQFEKDWYRCRKCYKLIEGIENHIKCKGCLIFSKNELINLSQSGTNK